ncbi:thiamine pyrophosphate-dependent enzyme [Streptomyces thinghirensis]|nr:thiamine pyrophosphate-dependent enzyme [Streptomyces thinghirensis]
MQAVQKETARATPATTALVEGPEAAGATCSPRLRLFEDGSLSREQVIERIGQLCARRPGRSSRPASASTRCGLRTRPVRAARQLVELGGAGTMGYAVPAAMGAKAGAPEQTVWAIDGDGCFQDDQPGTRHLPLTTSRSRSPSSTTAPPDGLASGDPVLQPALLQHGAALRPRGRQPDARDPGPRLREAVGGHGLLRHPLRGPRRSPTRLSKRRTRSTTSLFVADFIVHEDAMVWPMVAAAPPTTRSWAARRLA